MDKRLCVALLAAIVVAATGCSSATRLGASEVAFAERGGPIGTPITQAELADDLMRFEGRFADSVSHASAPLEASGPASVRRRALENELLYATAALDIAVAPTPEANLLDMVTFVELSRDVLEQHWIPQIFGAEGAPVEKAFRDASADVWAIAAKVLTPSQRKELRQVIREWRTANPDQIYVESVRLSEFAELAGQEATRIDQEARGLLRDVRSAVQAADAARMLGERAMFALQRMPPLLRTQARLTASDVTADVTQNLAEAPSPFRGEGGHRLETILVDLQRMMVDSQKTFQLANAALGSPNLQPVLADIQAMAAQLAELLKELNRTLESPAQARAAEQVNALADRMEKASNRVIWKAFLAACGVVLFAAIAFLSSRLIQQRLVLRHREV